MKKIFIYILITTVIALAGVLVWQFWPKAELEEPYIKILSPHEVGEQLTAGETYEVKWETNILESTISMILFADYMPGGSEMNVWQKEDIPNTGSYQLIVPESLSGDNFILYINIGEYSDSTHSVFIVQVDETVYSPSLDEAANPVAQYLKGAELQYETEIQKENIVTAFNDILNLSVEELKERRYKDYTGKENQWDLYTLIYRHFVSAPPGVHLGDNFFNDVKLEEAQEQVRQILEKHF